MFRFYMVLGLFLVHSLTLGAESIPAIVCIFDTTNIFPSTRINPATLQQTKNIHAIRALLVWNTTTKKQPENYSPPGKQSPLHPLANYPVYRD